MNNPKKTFKKFILHTPSSSLKPLEYLSKYAPKAHKALSCQVSDLKTSKVTHKIKTLKVLQALNIKDYNPESKAAVLKAFLPLKNHIKDLNVNNPVLLRHFPRLQSFTLNVKSLSSWKTFFSLVHLQRLTTEFVNDLVKCKAPKPVHPNISGYLNTFFWSHLSKLGKLKHFSLHLYNQFNEQLFRFFSRLNSLDSLLTSLKTLTLFFNHIEITFPGNFSFPNIYKSLTIFKAHESSLSSISKLLISPENFPHLEFISIIKTIQDFEEDFIDESPERNLAYFDFFDTIQGLQKVKEIDIAINLSTESGFKSFLRRFSLPRSVRAVKLNLYETCWYTIRPQQTEDFFAGNDLFSNFYSQWTGLEHLENLSLCFSELEINTSPSVFFISPIMRRLTTLKELYYANWSNNMWENKKKTIDFQHLWSCLRHLKPSLKTLYLENPAISLRNFAEEPITEGSGLEKLGFCGVVVGDKQISHLRGLFGRNIKADIEIERLLIDNEETLEEVLGNLVQIHRMVDFSINIDVRNIKAEILVDIICRAVPRFQRENLVRLSFCNISMDVTKPSLVEKLKMTFNSGGNGTGGREERGIRIYSEEGGILFTNRKRSLFAKMHKHTSFVPPGIGQMENEQFNEIYSLDHSLSGDDENGDSNDEDDLFESDDMMDSDDEDNEEIIEDF